MDIAVFAGGRSPEHDVSVCSAQQVLQHLDRSRWRVWPVYLARDGGFWVQREPLPADAEWHPGDATQQRGPLRPGAALDLLLDEAGIGCVLPVLHGPFGEDGTVQGMLELYGVPFVGSGCAASAVAMDKLRTRQCLQAAGLPLPRAYAPSEPLARADARAEFAQMELQVGVPCFVKTDLSGSTVGVQRVTNEAELAEFFGQFRGRFRRWFAEQQVDGEEITVAVLGNSGGALRALPPIGIYPVRDAYFTHRAKYTPGACNEVIPPRGLSLAQIDEVQALARKCHDALQCDGMSRTDMIVTADGPRILEVNTLPGMTNTSLLPQAAAAAGLPFPRLLDHLIELALARAAPLDAAAAVGDDAGRPAAHARRR